MDGIDSNELTHATQDEVAANPTSAHDAIAQNTAFAVDIDAMDFDGNIDPIILDDVASRSDAVAGRGGRARGVSSVRGRGMPRGRCGPSSRLAKRVRPQREDDGDDNDEDFEEAPKRTKKRQKTAPEPEAQPVEIHRRHTSLRDRLIKGVNTPQNIGMRAYKQKKEAEAAAKAAAEASTAQATARNPPREFLVPIDQGQNPIMTRAQPIGGVNSAIRSHQTTDMHPNPHIAYKSTPAHQLYFPEELVLALKQNRIKWDSKKHSEGLVFVVARIVNSDVADMRVFSTLQDATVDALHMMVNEHPEAFALPRTTDADGDEVKPPRMQRATSIIREITARPNFKQVSMSNAIVDQGDNSQNTGTQYADYQNTSPSYRGMSVQTMGREADLEADIDAEAEAEAEDSLFVIKGETPELPRPPRIADPRPYLNERGEVLLGDGPEPTYMFWGKCKISSFCLKMEARRVDGAPIKVSVHLKNLRKPLHDA